MKRAWLFLLLAAPALAADLPPDTAQEIIADFSGGLNTTSRSHKIEKKFSKNLRNVLVDENDGSFTKRNGFVQVGSTNVLAGITMMYTFAKENGSKEFIVSDSSQVLTTTDFKTFTFISSGLTTTNNLCAVQVRNKVWMSNGTDPVFTWDGTTRQKLDGTLGTPLVPTAKYLAFWQERVWAYNKPSDASALDFTSVITTDGVIIAPDDSRAWPAINELEIGRGDGQVGTALFVQQGQLQAGKTNSVYTVFGSNPSNYLPRKMLPDIGIISNDSVGLLDNNAYWLDQNGVYENGTRISDAIRPNIDLILKPTNRTLQNIWETEADFKKGNNFAGSTVTADGFVTIFSTLMLLVNQFDTSVGVSSFTLSGSTNSTPWYKWNSTPTALPATYLGLIGGSYRPVDVSKNTGLFFALSDPNSCRNEGNATWTFVNTRTGNSLSNVTTPNLIPGIFAYTPFGFGDAGNNDIFYTGDDVLHARLQYQVSLDTGSCPGAQYYVKFASEAGRIILSPSTTGQFLSDVSTLASVTSWGTLDSVRNTNGGSISYFFHTSTSAVNITTQTWQAITPGAIIGAPAINNYVQWAATITSLSSIAIVAANIDNVTIGHIEGQASRDRAFATTWKSRYWLSVATETSGNFSTIYVKSRNTSTYPNGWVIYQNINIRSFAKDGQDTLYAGSASTGVFYRLDYGTNDNGNAIDALYDTPDFNLGDPFRNAHLVEFELDVDKQLGGSLTVGISKDFGTYATKTFSFDGATGFQNKPVIFDGIEGKVLSFRIQNNQLDMPLNVNNLGVYYQPRSTR